MDLMKLAVLSRREFAHILSIYIFKYMLIVFTLMLLYALVEHMFVEVNKGVKDE